MQHSMVGDSLREPAAEERMSLTGNQAEMGQGSRERIIGCLRTFCRLALRLDRVCSAVQECCVRSRTRTLRAIVVR